MGLITREKIQQVLKKYIVEDKQYLFYERGMYINFVNKDTLINCILNDLTQPETKEVITSCRCGIYGDESGLDANGCSCGENGCK